MRNVEPLTRKVNRKQVIYKLHKLLGLKWIPEKEWVKIKARALASELRLKSIPLSKDASNEIDNYAHYENEGQKHE